MREMPDLVEPDRRSADNGRPVLVFRGVSKTFADGTERSMKSGRFHTLWRSDALSPM
jgi:hypothetical protein